MQKKLTYNQLCAKFPGHGAVAYVIHAVMNGDRPFDEACDEENLHGYRADIVAERKLAADFLAARGYDSEYNR